jgi:Na+/melibiose symporter-like transporter
MAVVYKKKGRALIKQNKHMKSICSNSVNMFKAHVQILKFIRNRQTFFVCLITVLCYGIGSIPATVWFILDIAGENHLLMKYIWFLYLVGVLGIACSHSINPLIWNIGQKLCRRKKQRPQGN